jgi:hypothetical protein
MKTKLGRKQVLLVKRSWAQHCRMMETKFLWLDNGRVMHLVYLVAVRNGIKSLFWKRNEETGRKCLKNFLRRHQEISVKKSEDVRTQERGVSPINNWLIIFKSTNPLSKPFNIILQDFTIATKPSSLLHSTNTRKYYDLKANVGYLLFNPQNGDPLSQSSTIWVLMVNIIVRYFYFQEKYMKPDLMNSSPPGSIHLCHPSEWKENWISTQWFFHFIKHTKPIK